MKVRNVRVPSQERGGVLSYPSGSRAAFLLFKKEGTHLGPSQYSLLARDGDPAGPGGRHEEGLIARHGRRQDDPDRTSCAGPHHVSTHWDDLCGNATL